jgi:hypothetical protein
MLSPAKEINRFMISCPSYFVSEFKTDYLSIQSAQPSGDQISMMDNIGSNPHARSFYIISFKSKYFEAKDSFSNLDNTLIKRIIILISVFFGKAVYEHGFTQWFGCYWLPNMSEVYPNKYYYIGPYNQCARKDLSNMMGRHAGDWLNWDKLEPLSPLIDKICDENEFNRFFFTAGEYYLNSLQSLNRDPEIAYLDLIMCGEVLSNFTKFNIENSDFYEPELKAIFDDLATFPNGEEKIKLLKNKIGKVRYRFTQTIASLLNNYYFQNNLNDLSQVRGQKLTYLKLIDRENIRRHLDSAYVIRSKFVHSGISFGQFIIPIAGHVYELQIGKPVIKGAKADFISSLENAPTFVGLERMMRYCLLRFIQKYGGVHIDDRLNDD